MDVGTEVTGRRWELTSILLEGRSVQGVVGAGAYMVLGPDMRVHGRGGCNRFFGAYFMDGDALSFGNIASTRMYCFETMHVEDAFFQAMGLITSRNLEESVLELRSSDGSTILRFEEYDEEVSDMPSPTEKDDQPPLNVE